ncbi:MAG: hypothetical protein ACRDV3_03835, partial [Acidothermaceae bacterium]
MVEEYFTVKDAMAAGATRQQSRTSRWNAPFKGVRSSADATDVLSRCRALSLLLPEGAVFTGMTAAHLRGWSLPRGALGSPLDITVPPGQMVARDGVRCRRRVLGANDISEFGGLQVSSGARTRADLAGDWSLVDLVVMGDAALRAGHCTPDQLLEISTRAGVRGVRSLRRALSFFDGCSESPPETQLRLLIVLSGLPAPTPQAIVRDADGGWLARVDLLGPDGVSIFEYDGAYHDEPARHASDVRRWRTLHHLGFSVYPYSARDLFLGAFVFVIDFQGTI